MKLLALWICVAVLTMGALLYADTVKDREGAVRADRSKMQNDGRWIYNDVERGFAEAKKSNKPLLVVLRCVPCTACMGIDASILTSKDLQPLLDEFICVRVINANALDLSLFQFDYDLSFSTLFFNADGTIYGRYGSWQHQRDSNDATTAGYKAALEAVLSLHHEFPKNKASLASKQGGPTPFKVPVEIPALAGKYERELNWNGKVVQSCVHCHQIGDAYRAWHRDQGKPMPLDLIYPMPAPETIGLTLDAQHAAKVKAVVAGSAAASAGLQVGDDLLAVNGAPLISIADLAWALHRAADDSQLHILRRRDGADKELSLPLAAGWRAKTDISTRVGTWQMRAMALGGMVLKSLSKEARKADGLDPNALGLSVVMVGEYGAHGAAKRAGFVKGDVLVSVEGVNGVMNESELIGYLLINHPKKGGLKTVVLRDSKQIELLLPMQ
jgi:serine protease Do